MVVNFCHPGFACTYCVLPGFGIRNLHDRKDAMDFPIGPNVSGSKDERSAGLLPLVSRDKQWRIENIHIKSYSRYNYPCDWIAERGYKILDE